MRCFPLDGGKRCCVSETRGRRWPRGEPLPGERRSGVEQEASCRLECSERLSKGENFAFVIRNTVLILPWMMPVKFERENKLVRDEVL